eukprot:TRINITY_DN12200_c0_g1_i1.p1 TRINITY_DN12200_c0_g1~~TRINITY_DN12200_c0_g1_i1.p1  ORF type:complete len:366 (-),score=57.63 TRINITY_DN12200_c0_g1_i1:179-1216(-)
MALIRTLFRGRSTVHCFGVEAYAGSKGGEELFALLERCRPRVVLMESFAAPDAEVFTGGQIPYGSQLNKAGLPRAWTMIEDAKFQNLWSCEAVGVLSALRIGAELRLADRYHAVSFDRLIAKRSLDEIRTNVVSATESLAQQLEGRRATAIAQNALCSAGFERLHWSSKWYQRPRTRRCPFFPELWSERHAVMANVTKRAADEEEDSHIALVVGTEHVDHVASLLDDEGDIAHLLSAPDDTAPFEVQVEKRCVLAALLGATRAFPQDLVLPAPDNLVPEAAEVVRSVYPKYHRAIAGRLSQAGMKSVYGSVEEVISSHQQTVHGLSQLYELCDQLGDPLKQAVTS